MDFACSLYCLSSYLYVFIYIYLYIYVCIYIKVYFCCCYLSFFVFNFFFSYFFFVLFVEPLRKWKRMDILFLLVGRQHWGASLRSRGSRRVHSAVQILGLLLGWFQDLPRHKILAYSEGLWSKAQAHLE